MAVAKWYAEQKLRMSTGIDNVKRFIEGPFESFEWEDDEKEEEKPFAINNVQEITRHPTEWRKGISPKYGMILTNLITGDHISISKQEWDNFPA